MKRQAIQNCLACWAAVVGGGFGFLGVLVVLVVEIEGDGEGREGKGGMSRHVPTRLRWWVERGVEGEEGWVQWACWKA